MKWRHWAVLIILLLLNYIIFSTAFTQLARQRRPGPLPPRTPLPTFTLTVANPVAWIVLPTSTTQPSSTPLPPTLTASPTSLTPEGSGTITGTVPAETPGSTPVGEATPTNTPVREATPTDTPVSEAAPTNTSVSEATPTSTPAGDSVLHVVQRGETLSEIAKAYGVTTQAIVEANDIENPNRIVTGQKLIIPSPKQTPTPRPTATANP